MPPESKSIPVYKKKCPICTRPTIQASSVSETEKLEDAALWYKCLCGVMFQSECPTPEPKDQDFIDNHHKLKQYDVVGRHGAYTYAPLIENIVYGRKFLDVGFGAGKTLEYMRERGWIGYGIDNNKDIKETDRIYKDDFETTEKIYQGEFDCIWMGFILEKFHNPLGAIEKARQILSDDGVLVIFTPDIDFLYSKPGDQWTHWKAKENYVLWSQRSLCRELENMGFNVVVKHRNYQQRFGYYNDLQIIAQKVYY